MAQAKCQSSMHLWCTATRCCGCHFIFSIWGLSQEEAGNDCGAVVAVAETWRTNPQRSVLCQEETSASGEAESSASGDTGKARGDTGKAQGGSVPQGRRAGCDRGDRPSRRGERESEKGPILQILDEAWVRSPFRCAALRRACSLQEGVLYKMRFPQPSPDLHGAIPPAEWFVVAGSR